MEGLFLRRVLPHDLWRPVIRAPDFVAWCPRDAPEDDLAFSMGVILPPTRTTIRRQVADCIMNGIWETMEERVRAIDAHGRIFHTPWTSVRVFWLYSRRYEYYRCFVDDAPRIYILELGEDDALAVRSRYHTPGDALGAFQMAIREFYSWHLLTAFLSGGPAIDVDRIMDLYATLDGERVPWPGEYLRFPARDRIQLAANYAEEIVIVLEHYMMLGVLPSQIPVAQVVYYGDYIRGLFALEARF